MDELRTDDLTVLQDPFALFRAWQDAACETEVNDPTAMAIATVDETGLPDLRMVLLKEWDERGFVFYTNFESAKGREIQAHPKVAALFHWKSQRKQIRIRGPVEVVDDSVADAYFASRARESRLGAWASAQSRPLSSRSVLEREVEAAAERFPDVVPRPPHWSGFRIRPLQIEFWADGAFRLHDRIVFARTAVDGGWSRTRLYP